MDRYKETRDIWNKIAGIYQDLFMDLDLYDHTYVIICSMLKQDARLLEIGCGPGNITKYLLTQRADFHILGTDIAPNMIMLAEQNNPQARFKVMDCRKISDLEMTFDGVICGFCLPYLSPEDVASLVADVYQLLHKQGLFYLSFVEGDPQNSGYRTGSSGDRLFFYYHQMDTLDQLFKDNHFEKSNLFRLNYTYSDGRS
jgi:cyclopropane fatty-acyl-phospholipid synthase-like methyltransferase